MNKAVVHCTRPQVAPSQRPKALQTDQWADQLTDEPILESLRCDQKQKGG